jgi:formate dehydrogenase subunit gamma
MPDQAPPLPYAGADTAPHGLLPALHALMEQIGHIPDEAIATLAKTHNVSRADVEGVIGFYHDFRRAPRAGRLLRICRAESCQAMGSESLAAHAERYAKTLHGSGADAPVVTIEAVYCLGNCACSPAAEIDGQVIGRVSSARLEQLIAGQPR